jgi:hypothetical protein
MGTQELYELDFFEWTQRNAELLSQGCFEQLMDDDFLPGDEARLRR